MLLLPLDGILAQEKFKRLFNLELQKDANVAYKLQASNVASSFRRHPRSGIENSQFIELGLGDFSVKSAREEIDKHVLVVSPSQNRWSKILPIKLNVFSWCMMLERLPTRWWNIHILISDDPPSWDSWLNGMNLSSMQRRILEATFISMWWHIRKFRNLTLFSSKKPRKDRIFDDIVSHTYFWLSNSVGRPAATSRGGGSGRRAGRGGGKTRARYGDQGNGRVNGQSSQVAQVGDQGRGLGNGRNQNGDAINDNIWGDVRNVIENNDRRGCTYKEFLACNPKEYDGKGGVVVYTRWIKKMESIQDMSGCGDNQQVKYTIGSSVGKALTWVGHAAYTDRFHELARLVPHLVTPKNRMIERYVYGLAPQILGMRGNSGEPSKDRNERYDNKRTRTGNDFATTKNHVRRAYTGMVPKCTSCNFHRPPKIPCRTCFNCNCPRNFAKDYREVPRNVNPINARNPTARAYYECGSTDHIKTTCPRLGAKEARKDQNIVTSTFTLNNHYAKTLFDSGADYSFVTTTFIPLLGIEPSDLGFSYEIEIASGQLVEIDKVELICHEKVVRIPLPDDKVLRVIRERLKEKMRHIRSAKAKEQKQEDIVVVRDYPKIILNDLSGFPPNQEIKFHIALVPGAIPVAKSPYRLAPSEMELSSQLKEL
nr:reverse transcriptase domain-containing protein [Tanacetum cinerariifolium]